MLDFNLPADSSVYADKAYNYYTQEELLARADVVAFPFGVATHGGSTMITAPTGCASKLGGMWKPTSVSWSAVDPGLFME